MMTNRIGRAEFLFWLGITVVGGGIAFAGVSALTNTPMEPGRTENPWPMALVLIAFFAALLKAYVSRFHDLGRTGWWAVSMFLPLANVLAILLLCIIPGQKQPNAYGDPQKFLQRLRTLENQGTVR